MVVSDNRSFEDRFFTVNRQLSALETEINLLDPITDKEAIEEALAKKKVLETEYNEARDNFIQEADCIIDMMSLIYQ